MLVIASYQFRDARFEDMKRFDEAGAALSWYAANRERFVFIEFGVCADGIVDVECTPEELVQYVTQPRHGYLKAVGGCGGAEHCAQCRSAQEAWSADFEVVL